MKDRGSEGEYPAIYYQTIADLGIDPVVCGPFGVGLTVSIGSEGCTEEGSGVRPVQLAEKALAKASGGSARVPRKRAPRKATAARAAGAAGTGAGVETAVVPKQAAAKTARGTAKVASSE